MQRHGMTLLPYAPLAGGFLSGKYQPRQAAAEERAARLQQRTMPPTSSTSGTGRCRDGLREFAQRAGRSMLELAFGWLLARPVTASVIAGASTPEQIEQNVRAGRRSFPRMMLPSSTKSRGR